MVVFGNLLLMIMKLGVWQMIWEVGQEVGFDRYVFKFMWFLKGLFLECDVVMGLGLGLDVISFVIVDIVS